MRENGNNCINEPKENRKNHRRVRAVLTLCSVLVAAAVFWQLISPGIAKTEMYDSDKTADIETEEQWISGFKDLVYTQEWGTDIVAIAKTQTGYCESKKNYIVTDKQEQKGYTRYGAWSGDAYGNWDTAFAAFCLHYANVPKEAFPVENDIDKWIEAMQEAELYKEAADIQPKAGNLIVLQKQEQETEKQIGIITEVEDRKGKTYIHTMEGNCDNQVKENEYEIDSKEILGYGLVDCAAVTMQKSLKVSGTEQTDAEEQGIGETINERLAIELTAGRNGDLAESGETLYAKVISRYSKANNPDRNVGVVINIGKLPEGVTLAGFANGSKEVVWKDEQNQEHTIILRCVEENGISYIEYEQPAGATVEFEVQFNSQNGIMANQSAVTLEIEKERITGLDTPVGSNDMFSGALTLTWKAKNEWDPVEKKVNNTKHNEIAVTEQNKLSGELIYKITANSSNNEDFGEIWTDYITVTDTLTLPENIAFPAGARVNAGKTAIVDENGKEIFYFSKMQQGSEITALTLNSKTVVYTVRVPNSHRVDGIPAKEQDNLSIEMRLDAGLLVLPDGYAKKSASEIQKDCIQNKVEIQPVPYKPYEVKRTEDFVTTVPALSPEEFVVEKEADKEFVQAGDTVTYTLSVRNNGKNSIRVQDGHGNFYQVTDHLPDYLYLTNEQIAKLPADVRYNEADNTILWIPSRTDITPGTECQMNFSATLKEASDQAMDGLCNGSYIKNVAQYKGKYSNETNIVYKKAAVKVQKSSKDENGDGTASHGEKITYTITITNETDLNTVVDELITDWLPKGLIFESAAIGNNTNITAGGTYTLHYGNSSEGEHKVIFKVEGQKLEWDVGIVHAHETIILTYVCTVDVEKLESKSQIWNTVETSSGGSDFDYITVDNPIELNKSVEQDTNAVYPDKTIFDYTISIQNDREHPSEKDDLELTDQLPKGMLPVDCTLIQHQKKDGAVFDKEVSWENFWAGNYDKNGESSFTSIIGGRKAEVEKGWNGIRLTWKIGKLNAGEIVKLVYRAQVTLTEEQKEEGGRYDFTNMAYADGISKSVTVHAGKAVGELYLEKNFNGQILWNGTSLTEEQKQIIFELTGIDAEGNPVTFSDGTQKQTVALADFNNGCSGRWSHVFRNLPVGTYTVIEKNAEAEGKTLTVTYQVDANHSVAGKPNQAVIKNQEQARMLVNNVYGTGASVDLQKSVWALKKETKQNSSGELQWSNLSDKKLFSVDLEGSEKTMVIYNMTIVNTGSEKLHLDTLLDELPEELNYIGICSDYWSLWNKRKAFTEEIITNQYGGLNLYDSMKKVGNVKISGVSDENNRVTFTFDKAAGGYELEAGKAVTFLMLCEVNEKVTLGKPISNTAKLIVDESIKYKDYEEIKTENTAYDQIQNNGASKDEGVIEGKRVISSTVTVIPENIIVPGIAKKAVSYIVPGKTEENPLNEDSNIQPNSTVKWEITLYNDGTKDLTDYKVSDLVTSSFHLMTQEEALEKKVSVPYRFEIYSCDGKSQKTIDLSKKVWKTLEGNKPVSEYIFEFKESEYSIPAGGYAKLTLYTNNTVENYKVYKNTATLLPSQEFNANEVKHGELKKDSDSKYIGVTASDEVNALGEYASVSWKTISEKENSSNTTRGTQEKNYISVDMKSEYVTYTNNIKNVSGKDFSRFTVIDLMPGNNDTGVVNQNDMRGSEFTISFAGGLEVYVLENGVKTAVDGYTAEFSNKTGFTQEDFDGAQSNEWHEGWQRGDCSFRIRLPEGFVLTPYQTLAVQYDGKFGADAKPGAIAWNSFGYQYYSGEHSTPMKAEPPKVGVLIPKVPIVQKEVVDSTGKVQEYDAGKVFTFELAEKGILANRKLCEFTLCQGGFIELSGLRDKEGNEVVLENGKEYVITEAADKMPEGYELVGIGEKGGTLQEDYTFVYYENKDVTIFARNKVDTYQYELPKTGGIGTTVYTAGGVLLMLSSLLLYGYRLRGRKERRAK